MLPLKPPFASFTGDKQHRQHPSKEQGEKEEQLLPAQMFPTLKCVLSDFPGGPGRNTVCLNLASSTSGQPLSLN